VLEGGSDKPRANVWVGKDSAVVAVELPGIGADNIDLRVEGRVLTVTAEGRERTLGEGESLGRTERRRGAFSRSFELPFGLDEAKVAAEYRAGLLTVTLPRAESEKPRKINVRS
jgi:HSP20 family protein